MKCPHCGKPIDSVFAKLGKRGGKSKSEAKSVAARENGKLGGRPQKVKANVGGTR
jgi:hypothetical protein